MTGRLPVAVIGAGPIGLAAAAHLLERGLEPVVLEAGDGPGHNISAWGHVRLFSDWSLNIDAASRRLLLKSGWDEPDPKQHPTGRELVERYLRPLAETPSLRRRLHYGARVTSIGRQGIDKMKDAGRAQAPFQILVHTPGGERRVVARAVIDASGTYGSPNPLGAGGVPAVGEAALRHRITYRIPAVLGAERSRYANKKVLVVGAGHSALNAIRDLAELQADAPQTRIVWAVRRTRPGDLLTVAPDEQLAERGRLAEAVRTLLADERLEISTGFAIEGLRERAEGVTAVAGGRELGPFDEIIAVTGYRPDLGILRELRLALHPAVESPSALAGLIDPNVHSCATVPPHGALELAHPEPDLYVVGMKSYGRAPTFLLLTGYEQVRSVAAALAGDRAAAERTELTLVSATDRREPQAARGSACVPARAASRGADAGGEFAPAAPTSTACATDRTSTACAATTGARPSTAPRRA